MRIHRSLVTVLLVVTALSGTSCNKGMRGAITGLKRLRGNLPAGTVVADKTGSGERDAQTNAPRATNDVGLITLPSGKGTVAVAVLVTGSKLGASEQESLIAELGRAIYDEYANN